MIIVCGNCQTRFQLEDSLLPAEGARVRCSRCQHRFHVKPPPPSLSTDEIASLAVEDTPQAPASLSDSQPTEERAAPRARTVRQEEDPDLENPEFLFNEPRPQRQAGETAPPQSREAQPGSDLDSGWLVGPEEESPEEALDEPAPTSLDESDESEDLFGWGPGGPGVTDGPFDLSSPGDQTSRSLSAAEAGAEAAAEEPAEEPGLPPSPKLGSASPELPSFEFETSPQADSSSPGSEFASTDSIGSPDDGWDDPDDDTSGDLVSQAAEDDVDAAYDWNALPPPSLAAAPAPRAEREVADRDATGRLLRSASVVVGALLLVAAGVGLWNFGVGARAGPAAVEGAGWRAESVEAFQLSSVSGEPILVIRGALVHQGGSAWLPLVRAQLLAADGSAVGSPAWGEPRALADAELSPSALSERLGLRPAHQKPLPRPAGRSNGFTVLIPRPPADAERYHLELVGPDLG
jgi:predicted Zn finger-like uncharacterized protein